jgi:hypothetical protein
MVGTCDGLVDGVDDTAAMTEEIIAEAEAIFIAHPELLSRFVEAVAALFRESNSLTRARSPLFVSDFRNL